MHMSGIQKEGKVNLNMIKTIKEDIQEIKEEHFRMCEKIKPLVLEEEFEGSDTEKLFCDEGEEFLEEKKVREPYLITCIICDFKCEREITKKKT